MRRRTHKKSRNGCLQCKRRHIKCDEARPRCVQCATAQIGCSFADLSSPSGSAPETTGTSHSMVPCDTCAIYHAHDHREASSTAPSSAPSVIQDPTVPVPDDQFPVNMLHLQLLHHFTTETLQSFTIGFSGTEKDASRLILKAAFSEQYLMHLILALAALHIGSLHPEHRDYYYRHSSNLQTQALSLLNGAHLKVDAGNCVAVVLFSSLLAMHSLCDLAQFRGGDYSSFLDGFIACLNLRRGIRAVTVHSWHLLVDTELQPFIQTGQALVKAAEPLGTECDDLRKLLNSSDLGQSSLNTCKEAVDMLQKMFNMERISGGRREASFTWPALIPADYTDLLMKRTPEALVILAYYAVLLHRNRDEWFIGDAGQRLLVSINRHLGPYWDSWMAWPNAVIRGSAEHTPHSPSVVGLSTSAS